MKLLAVTSLLLTAASRTRADGYGQGVAKSTHSASDPIAFYSFLSTHFPIHCQDAITVCNASFDCGAAGRGALCGRADCSYDATPSFPGEFGIHLVNTSARPYVGPGGGGGTDNADVEAHFARKLHGAIADGEVGCGGAHGGWVFSD